MINNFPNNWVECQIGEICDIVSGGTPDTIDNTNFAGFDGIPWITPADLTGFKNMYIANGKRFLSQKGLNQSSANLLPKGAVLFSSRAPIGYVAIAKNNIATNQGFKNFICPTGIYNQYVYYYLRNSKAIAEGFASGTTFLELSGKNAYKIPIKIPSFAEQKIIAARLDTLVTKIVSCKARLDKIPENRDLLLQKYIDYTNGKSCTLGQITIECKEKIGLNWENIPLIGVSNNQGITVLRIGQKESFEKYKIVQPGDIIYNTMRVNIGSIARYNGTSIALTSPDYVVFRVKPNYSAEYVLLFLKSTFGLEEINKNTKGSVRSRLYYKSLSNIEIPISKNYTQNSIETNLKAFKIVIEKIEKVSTQLSTITTSILAKAFRGELTAEWREQNPELISGENSAEALLERIKEEKENSSKPKIKKHTIVKNQTGIKMQKNQKTNKAPILEVLKIAKKSLKSQELLIQAGYPKDASTEELELFFLDIREQIKAGTIARKRQGNSDIFTLIK